MRASRQCVGRAPCRQTRIVITAAASSSKPTSGSTNASRTGHSIRAAAQLTAEERQTLTQGVSGTLERGAPSIGRTASDDAEDPSWFSGALPQQPPRAADTPMVWVFSYGGNMCCETLARRDISVVTRDPAFVVDPSVRVVFKHRGGHATLESLPPGTQPRFRPPGASQGQPSVHGVLYRLPAADIKLMESREQGYVMTQMEVETYEGVRVKANVWVSGALSRLPQEVTPPELYMKKLREGAAFNFIDPGYQAWLSSIETVTSAGLGSEYYTTPGRYISYSMVLVSLLIVGGWLSQHM